MRSTMADRILFLAGAALLLTAAPRTAAQVQQIPDSAFVPAVAGPAFTARHPRVLFDEAHNNFHRLDGRYQAFAALLRADGCVLTPNRAAFTAGSLENHDLLVIANAAGDTLETATDSTVALPAFTPEEVEAVHRWVSGGGALLLIADHAPFGSAAEVLGRRFGVDMSKGYTGDTLQAAGPGSSTNIRFARARKSLGDHPIMEGRNQGERIDTLVAFTGQSLRGPAGSTPLMILSEGAFDIPPQFLKLRDPEAMMAHAVPAKGRSMGVALHVGKGRALIQAEAAMLSAQVIVRPGQEPHKFGMNQPGLDNQQYALNAVRWLVGETGRTERP
jgi:hypothetical protein